MNIAVWGMRPPESGPHQNENRTPPVNLRVRG
jgi:hypothetical protein